MQQDQVMELLLLLGCQRLHPKRDWVDSTCPLAHQNHKNGRDSNPSFGMSVGKNSVAFCQACGYNHHVKILLDDLGMWDSIPQYLRESIIAEMDWKPNQKYSAKTFTEQFEQIIANKRKEDPAEVAGVKVSGELVAWAKGFTTVPLPTLPNSHPCNSNLPVEQFFNTLPDDVMGYLTGPKRKLTEETIEKFQLGWDHQVRRILVPTFDCKDRLVGFGRRALDDEQEPKFNYSTGYKRNFYLYNENRASKVGGTGYIVEGQFDVEYLDQIGYDTGIGVQGSSLSPIQLEKLIVFFEQYVLFPDPDKAGIKLAQQIYDDLSDRGLRKKIRVAISENWWNEETQKGRDPEEHTSEEIDTLFGNAVSERPIDVAFGYGIINSDEHEKLSRESKHKYRLK